MRAKKIHEHNAFKRGKDPLKTLGVGIKLSRAEESYVNSIIAKFFGDDIVNDKYITIDKKGWYWADSSDNAYYDMWTGPFDTKEEALNAGKQERLHHVYKWHSNKS